MSTMKSKLLQDEKQYIKYNEPGTENNVVGNGSSMCKSRQENANDNNSFEDLKFIVNYLIIQPFINYKDQNNKSSGLDKKNDRTYIYIRLYLFLVLLFGVGTECTASLIMSTNGEFYRSIVSYDKKLFLSNLTLALIVVLFVAIQKSCKMVFKEMVALQWRKYLVKIEMENYFNSKSYYYAKKLISTQDQRISQDTDRLTAALSELYAGSIVLPGVIVYYTIRLMYMFNWVVPLACFIFFLVGSSINWWCVHRVVPYVVKQEKYEGLFRYNLFWIQKHSDSIILLNNN